MTTSLVDPEIGLIKLPGDEPSGNGVCCATRRTEMGIVKLPGDEPS